MDKNHMDKSLFFITLSAICIWLIVDAAVGKKHLSRFLSILFPFMEGETTTAEMTVEEVEEAKNNAPTSSAIGSNKESAPISGVPYGATR